MRKDRKNVLITFLGVGALSTGAAMLGNYYGNKTRPKPKPKPKSKPKPTPVQGQNISRVRGFIAQIQSGVTVSKPDVVKYLAVAKSVPAGALTNEIVALEKILRLMASTKTGSYQLQK